MNALSSWPTSGVRAIPLMPDTSGSPLPSRKKAYPSLSGAIPGVRSEPMRLSVWGMCYVCVRCRDCTSHTSIPLSIGAAVVLCEHVRYPPPTPPRGGGVNMISTQLQLKCLCCLQRQNSIYPFLACRGPTQGSPRSRLSSHSVTFLLFQG